MKITIEEEKQKTGKLGEQCPTFMKIDDPEKKKTIKNSPNSLYFLWVHRSNLKEAGDAIEQFGKSFLFCISVRVL